MLLRVELLEAGGRLLPEHVDEALLLEHAHLVCTCTRVQVQVQVQSRRTTSTVWRAHVVPYSPYSPYSPCSHGAP